MHASPLGSTGLRLTRLGFGAAQLGNLYRATSDDEARAAVSAAWDAGIRYFDTAPHYGLGLSERRLGAALAAYPRDELVVSTKVGRLLAPTPDAAAAGRRDPDLFDVPATHARRWDFSRDGVLRSVEDSLRRTGLDRLDVLYLHDPDDHRDQAFREALPALVELRDQGVVRAIGAGMNSTAMLADLVRTGAVDVVMCAGRFTLLDDDALADLLPSAGAHGVGVVVAGVYNSGLLAHEAPPDDATFDYAAAPPALLARARAIAAVCSEHDVTLPQAAHAWVRTHPAVVSTVVGLRTAAHVRTAVEREDAAVPDATWAALWTALAEAGLLAADALPRAVGQR